jgi:hypothetical protein
MLHEGLLRQFGSFEGRRSRVYLASALVGSLDRNRCALVSSPGNSPDDPEDYHLVHVLPICATDVDRIQEPLANADEYRLYSWNKLCEFFAAFSNDASVDELCGIATRSQSHLRC